MTDSLSGLPGSPPPVLDRALAKHNAARRAAFIAHLTGGTSAQWLAGWLRKAGTPVGPTTIKDYRRTIQ